MQELKCWADVSDLDSPPRNADEYKICQGPAEKVIRIFDDYSVVCEEHAFEAAMEYLHGFTVSSTFEYNGTKLQWTENHVEFEARVVAEDSAQDEFRPNFDFSDAINY
jgi:hypothetical protein